MDLIESLFEFYVPANLFPQLANFINSGYELNYTEPQSSTLFFNGINYVKLKSEDEIFRGATTSSGDFDFNKLTLWSFAKTASPHSITMYQKSVGNPIVDPDTTRANRILSIPLLIKRIGSNNTLEMQLQHYNYGRIKGFLESENAGGYRGIFSFNLEYKTPSLDTIIYSNKLLGSKVAIGYSYHVDDKAPGLDGQDFDISSRVYEIYGEVISIASNRIRIGISSTNWKSDVLAITENGLLFNFISTAEQMVSIVPFGSNNSSIDSLTMSPDAFRYGNGFNPNWSNWMYVSPTEDFSTTPKASVSEKIKLGFPAINDMQRLILRIEKDSGFNTHQNGFRLQPSQII